MPGFQDYPGMNTQWRSTPCSTSIRTGLLPCSPSCQKKWTSSAWFLRHARCPQKLSGRQPSYERTSIPGFIVTLTGHAPTPASHTPGMQRRVVLDCSSGPAQRKQATEFWETTHGAAVLSSQVCLLPSRHLRLFRQLGLSLCRTSSHTHYHRLCIRCQNPLQAPGWDFPFLIWTSLPTRTSSFSFRFQGMRLLK